MLLEKAVLRRKLKYIFSVALLKNSSSCLPYLAVLSNNRGGWTMPLWVLSEGGSYRGARSCRTQDRWHSSLSAAGTAQVLRLEQGFQNGGTRATTYFGGGQDRALLGTHYPRVRLRRAADTARPRRGLALGAAHGIRLLVWERPHDID
jgi:hypothetical protein